jgi:imidazolonepropionase-like amidohydrolase
MILLHLTTCALSFGALAPAQAEHAFETDAHRIPEDPYAGSFFIDGATLHTAESPAFIGDLLVRDGRIAEIGAALAVPDGVAVIDGEGLHVAPGAIDTHSHMAISRGVNESTVSITADVDMTDVVDPEDIALYRALAGGTTTIQILHGSANAIGGRSELLKLRGRGKTADELRFEDGPQGIKFALGENPKRSNWGTPGERFPGTRLGVEAIYYRAFERAREYAAEWAAYEAELAAGGDPVPPRRDRRLASLAQVLSGELIVHCHSYRADEVLMLMRCAESFGFTIGTFHHVLEGYKVAAEIAEHGAGTSTFSDWWAYKIEAYDAVPGNAALLHEAGVLSTIKSDSDELVRHMYHEAAKSVGYVGMDRVEALKLVTLNAAKQLGVEDRVGSLAAGKDADLAILDADPLSVYSRVLRTFVDGELAFERRDAFGLEGFEPAGRELTEEEQKLEQLRGLGYIEVGGPLPECDFAVLGAVVHTANGQVHDPGFVAVRDGRVAAVGPGSPISTDGARAVIDGAGMHLYPGVIALDTTLGLTEIGAIRSTMDDREIGGDHPDLSVAASINADSAHIGVTRYNGITRAQSVPNSFGAIRGQSAVVAMAGDTWQEMLTVEGNMLHINFPRVSNSADEDERAERSKAERVLGEKFAKAKEYAERVAAADAAGVQRPPYDPRSNALARFATGGAKVALHAGNAQSLLHAARFAAEHELDAVLYGATEAWKIADQLAELGVPVVTAPVLGLPSSEYDPYDAPYAQAAVLARAGVPFALGMANDENPRNLVFHAGFAAAFGLGAEEALRAITLYPAQLLGLDAELGSIEVGKRADLVLSDGDLFEPTTRVRGVWIDGREADLTNRHTELYDRYRQRLIDLKKR